ncbi:MAG TPA: hypothetical protein VM914_01900 [Pyrinomonadaceae bacterium]|nr:hypothetical protein [Pyrinomonadaceae bacterium]
MKPSRRRNAVLLTLALACGSAAQVPAARERPTQTPTTPKSTPTNQPHPPQSAKPQDKSARDAKARADAARARRERQTAVAILLEVERDAASLEDPTDRARVVASCADALWDADEQRARAMFRRAWAAAVESDEADLKEAKEGNYSEEPGWFTRAREAVISRVAKRDARAGEEWARSLNEWFARREDEAGGDHGAVEGDAGSGDSSPYYEFTREGRMLALASSLAGEGEYAGAARVASPVFRGGVSGPLVEFLLNLRARAPEEADRLYLSLLANARANPSADANDVLLLSAYAVTPRLLAFVGDDGMLRLRALGAAGDARAQEGSAATRAAFYDAASSVLLRPSAAGTTDAASAALYFALGRLLPFFERDAPAHAPALRARMSAVAAGLEASRRASLESGMATHSLSAQNPADPLAPFLNDIGRLDEMGAGDDARSRAVSVAAKRGLWERARRLAGEIKNDEKRAAALSLIGVRQIASLPKAYAEAEADDFDKAAAFARQVELPRSLAPALRAYALAQAAGLAHGRRKDDLAYALLDDAIAYAQQVDGGTGLRAAAALTVATFAARLSPSRSWETLAAAVAALNADEEFSGDVVEFEAVKYGTEESQALAEIFAPFTVERLFEEAGAADLARAAAEARNIEDAVARDYALVAAARAALRKGSGRAELLRRGGK